MKKKWILLVFLVIILLGGGVVVVWKISQKNNSTNQPTRSPKPPLNELSDQELEKCLLEDFSRRLELKKYFVLNLGELSKGKVGIKGYVGDNIRAFEKTSTLSKDLTNLASKHGSSQKKDLVLFLNSVGESMPEYSGDELDKKIDEKNYLILEKDEEIDYKGAMPRFNWDETNSVFLKIKKDNKLKSKSEAFEVLKTDPVLAGKV